MGRTRATTSARFRLGAIIVVPLLLVAGIGVAGISSATTSSGNRAIFEPLSPARILDTRIGLGAPAAPLGGNSSLTLTVAGAGGVPADATAAVLNITVTTPTAPSYLTVWPAGESRPTASNISERGPSVNRFETAD
jgi:hypothetical protein